MRSSSCWTSSGWRSSISASRYSATVRSLPENSATKRSGIGVAGQGDRREPQARGPPFRSLVQQRRSGLGQRDTRGIEQLACFALGEAQIGRADLGELAGQAQLMQAQPQIATRGQHRVHVRGKVRQQPGELSERFRRGQLVQIIDDQR